MCSRRRSGTLVFDLNDFDETLPGPFEYDVKRMAASFTIAARNNGFSKADGRAATLASAQAYRESMAEFAEMRTMDIWYAHLSEQDLLDALDAAAGSVEGRRQEAGDGRAEERGEGRTEGAHARQPAGALEARRARRRAVPDRQPAAGRRPAARPVERPAATRSTSSKTIVHEQFRAYRETLQDDRRHLLERFEWVDMARKVVGVGSVGTRAFIVLLQGRDEQDPLFLQVKEATTSVLEDHLPKSRYEQPGERVVQGQRLMQAASDIFLGWTKGAEADRYLYWRQLRDMKGSAVVEAMAPATLAFYARVCGDDAGPCARSIGRPRRASPRTWARRTKFDQSIADFSERYADQNDQDYQAFCDAVRSGRLEAVAGI